MGIAALGMAVAYLLLVAAGAVGSLLILLWLFRDAPGRTGKIEHKQTEGSRSARDRERRPRFRSSPSTGKAKPRKVTL